MPRQNVIIDYLGLSFKDFGHFGELIKSLNLPLDDFREVHSNKNYEFCVQFANCIYLHYTTSDKPKAGINKGCYIELTGTGCRLIETWNDSFNWFAFLNQYKKELTERNSLFDNQFPAHISRLDVACDLLDDEEITFPLIHEFVESGCYVSKCKRKNIGGFYSYAHHQMQTIYFGRRESKSNRLLRIYDKAQEQGLTDGTRWIRFEFEFRNDSATSFFLNLCNSAGNWAATYYGVLMNFLRFTETPTEDVKDYSRVDTVAWWDRFCNGIQGIKQLYLPAIEYTPDALRQYVHKNCASSIKAYLMLKNGDFTELHEVLGITELNRRQKDVLAKAGIESDI